MAHGNRIAAFDMSQQWKMFFHCLSFLDRDRAVTFLASQKKKMHWQPMLGWSIVAAMRNCLVGWQCVFPQPVGLDVAWLVWLAGRK